MKKIIVTTVLGVILSTSAVAEAQKFRFEFLNKEGTEALGVGHGHFDPDTPDSIAIQGSEPFVTHLKLTQIGITVNGPKGSARYVHKGKDVNGLEINDLYPDTWLYTDESPAMGPGYSNRIAYPDGTVYSGGTLRIDGKWKFGTKSDRKLELNFSDHTWKQNTMEIQSKGKEPVRVTSKGIFRLKMVAKNAKLPELDKVLDEDTTADSDAGGGNTGTLNPGDAVPDAPELNGSAINIFDNTKVDNIIKEAKNTKSGSGALGLGFLMLGVLSMAIRRRWSNA